MAAYGYFAGLFGTEDPRLYVGDHPACHHRGKFRESGAVGGR